MTSTKCIVIRNEEAHDQPIVEAITRQAFYNIYIPGCVEHYLVHIMRQHEDFVPELGSRARIGWPGDRQYHVHQSASGR